MSWLRRWGCADAGGGESALLAHLEANHAMPSADEITHDDQAVDPGSSVTVGSWCQNISDLRTNNQTSALSGLDFPLAWNEGNPSEDHASWSWEPELVAPSAPDTSRFTRSGQTRTMADGSI